MLFFFFFFLFFLYQKSDESPILASLSIFSMIYIGFGITTLVLIPYHFGKYNPFFLLFIYLSIWSNDSFAYLIGRKIGKKKLFPRISPSKTWEGAIGGILGSVLLIGIVILVCVFFNYIIYNKKELLYILISTIFIGIIANFGDLFESLLKRYAGVKDSSSLLPSHGGFLDRLDSLIFTGPFLYIAMIIIQKIYYHFNID